MCTLTGEMKIPDTEQKLLSKPQDLDGRRRFFFLSETFFWSTNAFWRRFCFLKFFCYIKMRFFIEKCVFEKLDWGVLGAYGV